MKLRSLYENFFCINEIQTDVRLQWFMYVIAYNLFFFVASSWWQSNLVEGSSVVCPEYFQSCDQFKLFQPVSHSWGYWNFVSFLSSLLMGLVWAMATNSWVLGHLLLLILVVFKVLLVFVLSGLYLPSELFITLPMILLLFSRHKRRGLEALMVALYVSAGVMKLHEGWLSGSFFLTYSRGMPFIPDALIPLGTNLLVALELAGSFFLLSTNQLWRRTALVGFASLHLYSVSFVGPLLMTSVLPMIVILFSTSRSTEVCRVSKFTYAILLVIFFGNLLPFLIPGDHKITNEGEVFASNVFDAERVQIATIGILRRDGSKEEKKIDSLGPHMRRPYPWWVLFETKKICADTKVERVSMRIVASHNALPFREIVNEPNACRLKYNLFKKNNWIKADGPVVGYMSKKDVSFLERLQIHPTPQRDPEPVVDFLRAHVDWLLALHLFLASGAFCLIVLLPWWRQRSSGT